MSENFTNILTIIGQQKKAQAEASGVALNINTFKVGDGNGAYYEPSENQTALVNVKYTGTFVAGTQSQIMVNPSASNEVLYKCFIPADVGGFTIRELGLFDVEGNLILICKLPAQDKFALSSGLYQPLTFTPKIIYTNPQTQAVLTPTSQIVPTTGEVSNMIDAAVSESIESIEYITPIKKTNDEVSLDFDDTLKLTSGKLGIAKVETFTKFCFNSGNLNAGVAELFSFNPLPYIPWVNPKMTSTTAPTGTVTSPGRLHSGNPWSAFSSDGSEVIYYRGYSGIQPASTKYQLASGEQIYLTKILPEVTNGASYIHGTGCYVRTYLNEVITELGQYVFASGLVLATPVLFDTIEFYNFYGGGHGDLVGWGAFPLEGYYQNPNSSGNDYKTVYPKIGGSYANAIGTNIKGQTINIFQTNNINMTGKANGVYNIFAQISDGSLYVLANTIYRQPVRPTMLNGDVWLNNSVEPIKAVQYNGAADIEFLDIPVGTVTMNTNVITAVSTFAYKQNGHEINGLSNDWSRSFPNYARGISKSNNVLYTAECNGWGRARSNLYQQNAFILVNEIDVGRDIGRNDGVPSTEVFRPIPKGATYRLGGNELAVFYPTIGES